MISGVHKFTVGTTDNLSEYVTESLTPVANRLYLLATTVRAVTPPGLTGVTGGGLTWEVVTSVVISNTALYLLRALSASPGAPGALTIDWDAAGQGCGWGCWEYDGVDLSGSNGSGAIVQSNTESGSGVNTGTITLSDFGHVDNRPFACIGIQANNTPAGEAEWTVQGATWTVASHGFAAGWRSDAPDTSIVFNWTATSVRALAAVEIKAAQVAQIVNPRLRVVNQAPKIRASVF